jgi:hypothetical protein
MLLFTILSLTLILLIAFLVLAISTFGAASIIVFADVIVCCCIIGFIIYKMVTNH